MLFHGFGARFVARSPYILGYFNNFNKDFDIFTAFLCSRGPV